MAARPPGLGAVLCLLALAAAGCGSSSGRTVSPTSRAPGTSTAGGTSSASAARVKTCLNADSDLTVTPLNKSQLRHPGLMAAFAVTSEGTQYVIDFWDSAAAAAKDVAVNHFAQQFGSVEVNPRPGANQVGQQIASCVRGA